MRSFPDCWIGSNESISWASHLSDITLWDSFYGRMSRTECMLSAWPSSIMRLHQWCDCLSNLGHVGQSMAGNLVILTLFVPAVGHMLKCNKLTTFTQIFWVPRSYTTDDIHLAFTFFHSVGLNWGGWKGMSCRIILDISWKYQVYKANLIKQCFFLKSDTEQEKLEVGANCTLSILPWCDSGICS
jgi:hypothetical protein